MTRVVPTLHDRHAPITLQDAFFEAIDAYDDWKLGDAEPTVRFEDKNIPVSSIFGRMRTSDDILPEKVRLAVNSVAGPIDLPAGTRELTYAIAAARMRELTLERLRDEASA